MVDRQKLYELWQQGKNKDRPQFLRQYREEFVEHLSDSVVENLPAPDASTFEYRQFLNDYKGTVTAQLNPENAETTNTDADEHGDE